MSHPCLIAFGSNRGDPEKIFAQVLERLEKIPGTNLVSASSLFQTRSVGGPEGQPDYFNGAILLETALDPEAVLDKTSNLERALGRTRQTRWGARTVDLDLLLFGQLMMKNDRLTIPHPRMSFRRFVLDPANEIAGQMVHPVSGRTVRELRDHLDRTPRQVVWVCKHRGETRERFGPLFDHPIVASWKLKIVDCGDDYRRWSPDAKLVIWSSERPEKLASVSFPGPALWLPDDEAEVTTEILAALKAMEG